MNYDVDYFIKKFEAIPEGKWCVFEFTDDQDRHCALGHTGHIMGTEYGEEALGLQKVFSKNGKYICSTICDINNGCNYNYQQPTPKQRILAALYDIKKMQEPAHTDITKELAVLPVNETSDLITTNILQ